MSKYLKTIITVVVAVAIAALQAAITALQDGRWTLEDTLVVLVAVLGVLGVYLAPNTPAPGEARDPTLSVRDGNMTKR